MVKESIKLIVEGIKQKILDGIKPESIILFGSFARGTVHVHSDVDLLVVWNVHETLPNVTRRIMLRKLIGFTEIPVDVLTYTTEELKRALQDEKSFTSQIVREGEVIYGGLG